MKSLMIAPTIVAVALVGGSAQRAHADECNKLTFLTFSKPIELPGVALPAGTYRFTHPDCSTDVLRVSSIDGTVVYGTFPTVPERRLTPTDKPEVLFGESAVGGPETIQAWFYPGDTIGDRLIYRSPAAPAFAFGVHADTAAKPITDQQFVLDAAHANLAQVALGKIVESKTINDEVKRFARQMVTDHQKALDDLKPVARDANILLPTELDAKDRELKDQLEVLSGSLALDRAYMRAMVEDHRNDVTEFRQEAAHAKNDELKQYAARTLPTLESHLKLARELDRSIAPSEKGSTKAS